MLSSLDVSRKELSYVEGLGNEVQNVVFGGMRRRKKRARRGTVRGQRKKRLWKPGLAEKSTGSCKARGDLPEKAEADRVTRNRTERLRK